MPAAAEIEQERRSQPLGVATPAANTDLCRAGDLAWLVGKPRTEIPVPVDVTSRRVLCTTCPVDQNYDPNRVNIFFDADTDVIQRVSCG